MGGYAWVTLATNDAYSLGALVLAHSLRRVGTKHELAVLVTPGVTEMMREKLGAVFNIVQEVNVLDSKDQANLALLARPELGITFTKLHCWRLTQYEKCVFVDADTLVIRNCDELFEREELSAAPDVGWPDCFNSGVFVFKPSQQTFASITAFAAAKGSFDGGDQGLLNMYFNDWAHKDISKHLPFIYNMCSTATYSYLPAFKQFGEDVRIIHFIGITKPWLQYFDTITGIVQPPMGSTHLQPLLQLWWNIFCDNVHPQLSPAMATSTLAPIWYKFSPPKPSDQSLPYHPSLPRSPVHYDANYENYERYSDIYIEAPDFSEFKDPWENYFPRDDPFINDVRQNGSSEWSTYTSNTDYSPKPPNESQHWQQNYGPVSTTYSHVNSVKEAIEYHARVNPPQRRQSRNISFEDKGQQTEICSPIKNSEQIIESERERWKSEISVQHRNGHQEYKHASKHQVLIYEHHHQPEHSAEHHKQQYHHREQYHKQKEEDERQQPDQHNHPRAHHHYDQHQHYQEQMKEIHRQHSHDKHQVRQDYHHDRRQDQERHNVHLQDQYQQHHIRHQEQHQQQLVRHQEQHQQQLARHQEQHQQHYARHQDQYQQHHARHQDQYQQHHIHHQEQHQQQHAWHQDHQQQHHARHQDQHQQHHVHHQDQYKQHHMPHQDQHKHHHVHHQDQHYHHHMHHHNQHQQHHAHHQDQYQQHNVHNHDQHQQHHAHHQDQYQQHNVHHQVQHHHHHVHRHDEHHHDHHRDQHVYRHTEHHDHRPEPQDHQAHQQFIQSIISHEEHKQENYSQGHEQQPQHTDSRNDESYCQRISENGEHHKNEQLEETYKFEHKDTRSEDQQTDIQRTESYPSSVPCTDLHNVATQSDPNITGDCSNAGLPGALAQMTLGQPRTAEQIALEEHMRKQSWEQGQIDYMGRDSFDNIWKKICETLSLAPQRQPTPPKETPGTEETAADPNACALSIDETDASAKTAKEATDSTEQIQMCKVPTTETIVPPARGIDTEAAELPTTEQDIKDKLETTAAKQETEIDSKKCETCPTQKSVTSEQAPSTPTTPISQKSDAPVCPLMSPAKKGDASVQETEVPKAEQDKPIVCALKEPSVTQPQALKKEAPTVEGEETKTFESDRTAEVTSPVPIQVAESVLQAEPKESVSEDPRPMKEEIVSSVEVPVQESVAALSMKPMEPITSSATCVLRQESTSGQANGSLSVDALAKLQFTDTATSPTTICPIPPKADLEREERSVKEGEVSAVGVAEAKHEVQETCPTTLATEAPKLETEIGTGAETLGSTPEIKKQVTSVESPMVKIGAEADIMSMSKTETVVADLSKSEVPTSGAPQSETVKTTITTPVAEAPKCELPGPKTIATETPVTEVTKSEKSKVETIAPVTPVTEPPKCELPKMKTTPETPVAELPTSEPCKGKTPPASPIGESPKCELLKTKTTSETPVKEPPKSELLKDETTPATPTTETTKSELPKVTPEPPLTDLPKSVPLKSEITSATPVAETLISEQFRTDTPATPVAEEPKCELPKAKAKQETPAAEPSKTETPATSITEAAKCELPPTEAMPQVSTTETSKPKEADTAPQTPAAEPFKSEPLKAETVVMESPKSEPTPVAPTLETAELKPAPDTIPKPPSTKTQETPKPDPLKMPTHAPEVPSSDTSTPSTPKTPESPSETPVRPTRTKEMNIPPTPTVTEATPPTSPPISGDPLDLETQAKAKKTTKKVLKKSASECESGDGADGDGEKKTKKAVKKVAKKAKESQEEGAESSGAEKPKKTAKVAKKITKPSQTLGTDPSVPETPPPGNSDAPVPPKRKVKSTTTAKSSTSGKKSDEP